MEDNSKLSKQKAFLVPTIILIVLGVVLFVPAGSFRFWEAWIFWSEFSVLTLFITIYFLKKSPELLSRRMQFKEKETTRKSPAFLNLYFLCYVIPGLDFRFHWSTVPVWLVIAANAIVFLGYIFIILVFKENSYASTIIQVEKEQRVITTGPYAIVRHPMYLGMLLMMLFTPLALGSYWAIIPALLCIPMNVFRIIGEEEVLLRDLPGYKDYCIKTRYRLIPLVW
ncbi:Protein-S-isoprenylcysteine O-methyltransferase Ste14 [Desulfotomaculum arcticum]|uniref:Protein-S-isoprenylcysteine O-methyltransferase Ste14 n=1 Tax=Desulfotruncus arcticus DSM 17038 TaxID=1121424 RepID=A0A1I2SV12_9FIRM|nr:isoprenylcysteine carboxylmethyltransferase family protein [Desulfotruncus arcticus]SFG54767.1 Protein-S-isoprenylcysteine O-methyltransferase Ste14 [Desulfotomaculum arcticum] [Desulfotruncus arcticus DSM 17038]